MAAIFQQVLLLMLFAVIGYMLAEKRAVETKHAQLLSRLEVYVFIPAVVIRSFSTNCTPAYLAEKAPLMLISAAILGALCLLAIPLAKRLSPADAYRRNLIHYTLSIPNFGFMGYALAGALFGGAYLLDTILFSLPLLVYAHTVGYAMLTKTPLSIRALLNPGVLSVLIGMALGLSGLRLPTLFDTLLADAAACMAPISMLLTGIMISQFHLKPLLRLKVGYLVVAIRLVAIPTLIAAAMKLLGLEEYLLPALFIHAMPTGMNTVIFPTAVGEDCAFGASTALLSNPLCCMTIPLCFWLCGLL